MTPNERALAVLNRWCGEDAVDDTTELLKELWDRTKPSGKPSHSAIDFFDGNSPGAQDLVNRLTAEFHHSPARKIELDYTDLNPDTGPIKTIDDLFEAVIESPPTTNQPITTSLSTEAHNALVEDIVARLQPMLTAAQKSPRKAKTAAKKRAGSSRKGR
jgi:hypothetical protein